MANIVPFRAANLAPLAPVIPWPRGMRSALFLAFDVDAESAWTSLDPENVGRLVTMSYGGYEARVAVPKILELLRAQDLKATFFVPGWTAEVHTSMCEAILEDGHEIGHHGCFHLRPEPSNESQIQEEIERGLEILKRRLGVTPVGYRAPFGETCDFLLRLLRDSGFLYSSSLRDDIRPYRNLPSDKRPGTIELPVSPSFDDWQFGLTHRQSPRSMFGREHVMSIWRDEIDEMREWGGITSTVLHPQVSGRPLRFRILRDLIAHAKGYGDIWIASGREIATFWQSEIGLKALRNDADET
jgi:peptidoglycan/xylan/chitin deacetylase (PgdA/CDA1 family)